MKTIEIRNSNSSNLNEVIEMVQLYQKQNLMLISSVNEAKMVFILSDKSSLLIWNTNSRIIAKVFN